MIYHVCDVDETAAFICVIAGVRLAVFCIGARHKTEALSKFARKEGVVAKA